MFLEISTTHRPATDLGFLLGKHPDRVQSRDLSFGKAHIFFPEATSDRCSAVLLLEIDAIALSRNSAKNYAGSFQLGHYVNDRPYTASSFLSTAIAKVFGSALNGNCRDRPDLAGTPIPLEITVAALPSRGGAPMIHRFFKPLGYEVEAIAQDLDPEFPQWGESPYFKLSLRHRISLQELLMHLYILVPALDNNKHYYVDNSEIDKLLDKSGNWLETHPEARLITRRYLKHKKSLTEEALDRLLDSSDTEEELKKNEPETELEKKVSLHQLRHERVLEILKQEGVQRVLDLGCGSGKFLKLLLRKTSMAKITGVDVSYRALEIAQRRLHLDTLTPKVKERIQLLHGALTYRDDRLKGYDAAVAIEVIEHLDLNRLRAFEQALFLHAQPDLVIITTPNIEYNQLFEKLPASKLRHSDHRFEWTRKEFQDWAENTAGTYDCQVKCAGIGPEDEQYGCPSQVAVFRRLKNDA